MRQRTVGEEVLVHNGRRPPARGSVIGYVALARGSMWTRAYAVRLTEGCDTESGLYIREIVVHEEDLVD